MKEKIIFFGNTQYSLIGLKIIHEKIGVTHIVTIAGSPVENFAVKEKIPLTVTKIIDDELTEYLRTLEPDFLVVEDYGLILPDQLLNIPKFAPLNIHHSLLPKYRGPSPVPSAILAGEKKTGVTIIKMSQEVDTGDILSQTEYEMKGDETTDSLLKKLNQLGADLLVETINNYDKFSKQAKIQGPSPTPYTDRMTRESGFIDIDHKPQATSHALDNMIRAYYPWPGVWFRYKSKAKSEKSKLDEKIIKLLPEDKIQVEGKNPMSFRDFANGYPEGSEILKKLGFNEK